MTEGQSDGPAVGTGPEMPFARRPLDELRFAVVGAYVADCFVSTARLPAWGEEYQARSIRTSPGGKALNQAVALARLGTQVAAIGAVGDDGLGGAVLAALARERIDISWVEPRASVATPICLCFVGDDGESAIIWHIDDDVAVTPETVNAATPAIERADAVLTTFEIPVESVGESIRTAKRHDCRVFVQPAPLLADHKAAATLPWDLVDVLVPNEIEARALLRDYDDMAAADLAGALAAELGVPTVVVTLGESGCFAYAAGTSRQYLAHPTVAVDTTGASDAFTATLAAYMTADSPLPEAIDAAQAAAAAAIQRPGGHESMPTAARQI